MTSKMSRSWLLVLALVACKDATGEKTKQMPPTPAPEIGSGSGSATGSDSASGSGSGSAEEKKGINAEDYVPAEFKSGMSRWRDTGVYIDGKPVGFLNFDELPIALKPTWVKDKVSQNKPPGCPECPAWKWTEQRFYKFTDYLRAVGVDLKKIKTLHVVGPKLSQTVEVSGAELLSKKADDFLFRFGAEIAGKPIPHTPEHFGNNKHPDKINGVMVYITKKPPTITREGLTLDGVDIDGIPYYGEPVRGGVRVYLDDKLAAIIKRQDLDVKKATKTADGELHWNLEQFLAANGVDMSKIVEGWVVRDFRRKEHFPWSELKGMSFSAGEKAHGEVMLGDKNIVTHVLALHTHALTPADLPEIRPEEEP
jgi:hypothetical protein